MGRSRRATLECPLNADLPVTLVKELDDFCDAYKIKKKIAVELALRQFLIAHQRPKP